VPANILVGNAVDLETGATLYFEKHQFEMVDGKRVMRTSYVTPSEKQLGARDVFYQGDRVARYQLKLNNVAYSESVNRDRASINIRVDTDSTKERTISIDRDQEVIIDAGFNEHILRKWGSLKDGERIVFDFASTAQLDVVRLQVTQDKDLSTDNIQMFSMTAANPFIRLLMKPIKAGYYKDTKQLAYYRGVSNLKDDNGEAYKVEITFENNQLQPLALDETMAQSTAAD
jgi:hypothetical protein